MKKLTMMWLLGLLFALMGSQTMAQHANPMKPSVHYDSRTELMGLVFHLAGAPEFNSTIYESYMEEADAYFASMRRHKAVRLAAKLYGPVSYDAVMSYALKLRWVKDDEGHDRLCLSDRYADDPHNRWTSKNETRMLELLNDFVDRSDFWDFYHHHEPFYTQVEQAITPMVDTIDMQWYASFFAPSTNGSFTVIPCLFNGVCNFNITHATIDSGQDVTAVMGCCYPNAQGRPCYNWESVVPILVHEFCHTWCNQLNEEHWGLIDQQANGVFASVAEQMRQQAYGNPTYMMNETFVRAATICYMESHYPDYHVEEDLKYETQLGFLLTRTEYESLRRRDVRQYPLMRDYMPSLCSDINGFDYMGLIQRQQTYRDNCAQVVSCNIKDGDRLKSGSQDLVIRFNHPMNGKVALWQGLPDTEFPGLDKSGNPIEWNDDMTVLTVHLALKPKTGYSFYIHESFSTQTGYPLYQGAMVKFSTR